jgi:hypothetical protein
VKATPLLATPPTVTTTLPVVAPLGTGAAIDPAPQLVGVAAVPLNVTVLVPCVVPKFTPVMVTDVPTVPDVIDKPEMLGGGVIVNVTPLLAIPFTVATTTPVVAPAGTDTAIDVGLQLLGTAGVASNVNVLVPCAGPKPDPVTVATEPTGPAVGDKVAMLGLTVKATTLLGVPLAVTSTLPVVAPAGTGTTIDPPFQLVGVAPARLNITVLVPCVDPKLLPVIVICVAGAPLVGFTPVIEGVTPVKGIALLANPF